MLKKGALVSGVCFIMMFSQGIIPVEAKGKVVKKPSTKQTVKDQNKDGIPDNWELKYKLGLGKNVAKQDNDKDGLNNLTEYKLNLNPISSDTNHNGIKDGNEDSDKDGLTNLEEVKLNLNPLSADTNHNGIKDGDEDSDKDGLTNLEEVELNLNPASADTDHNHVKDGQEVNKDGVQISKEVRSFELKAKTSLGKEIEIQFKRENGKESFKIEDNTGLVTSQMAQNLANDLYAAPNLTSDTIVSKVKTILQLDDSYQLQLNIKFYNNEDFEINKEVQSPTDDQNTDDPEDQGNTQVSPSGTDTGNSTTTTANQ